jgi:hypothetical protein
MSLTLMTGKLLNTEISSFSFCSCLKEIASCSVFQHLILFASAMIILLQKTSTVSQVENAPANKFIALNPELNGLEHFSYNVVSSTLLPFH